MRVGGNWSLARGLFGLALLASAAALPATTARAQGRASRDAVIRQRNAEMMRELEIKRREGTVREAKLEEPPHPILPYARGKEDFRELQLANNELMRAVFVAAPSGPTDYVRVAEGAGEINKRASRLKSNLRLPEQAAAAPRPAAPDISDDRQLRASLLALDKLVMEFVNNPAFRRPETVDVRQSAAAAESLARITELSRAVRLGAERLRKARESEPKRSKG